MQPNALPLKHLPAMDTEAAACERDAWLFPIGPYQFGRINIVVRWI
jgi:hypothetical protein